MAKQSSTKHPPWRDAKWQEGLAAWRRVNRFSTTSPFEDLLLRRRKVARWAKYLGRAATVFFVVMLLGSFGDDDCYPFAVMALYAMHAAAKFVFAFDATRALNEDKRSSALELLLATPLSEREIVEGQGRAFRAQFRRPVRRLFWCTVGAQFVAIFSSELRLDGEDLFLLSSFIWGPMIWTWSDYRVVTSLGMRHALRESSHTRAMLRTFAEIVAFPWAPFFPALLWMAENRFSEEAAGAMTFAWAIGGAIYQARRARRARTRMIRELRSLVAGDGESARTEGRRFAMVWNAVRILRGGTGSLARS